MFLRILSRLFKWQAFLFAGLLLILIFNELARHTAQSDPTDTCGQPCLYRHPYGEQK